MFARHTSMHALCLSFRGLMRSVTGAPSVWSGVVDAAVLSAAAASDADTSDGRRPPSSRRTRDSAAGQRTYAPRKARPDQILDGTARPERHSTGRALHCRCSACAAWHGTAATHQKRCQLGTLHLPTPHGRAVRACGC